VQLQGGLSATERRLVELEDGADLELVLAQVVTRALAGHGAEGG